jgi:TetR/AcrR family transcriptional repressor of lfrA
MVKQCSAYAARVGAAPVDATTRASRTRRDIVAAAIDTWALDTHASLGAVAAAAGVGRTTVHRYFPDRDALVGAVDQECRERFDAAAARASLGEGRGAEALGRLLREVVALGPVLGLVFVDDPLVDPETWEGEGRPDPFEGVVVRGLADGSLDPDVPAGWIVVQCWAALFGASLALRLDPGLRHRVGELTARTLLQGVALGRTGRPQPSSVIETVTNISDEPPE